MGQMKDETAIPVLKWTFVVFLGMGLLILMGGLSLFVQSSASEDWPTVNGVILSSEITTYEETTAYTEHREGRNKGKTVTETYTMFKPGVKYKYTANSMQYECDRRSFFDGAAREPGYAREIVAKYPVGKVVVVFYDPDKPGEAVLEAGTQPIAILIMSIVGFVVCAISTAPLYGWRKLLKDERARQKKLEENAEKRRQIAEKKKLLES